MTDSEVIQECKATLPDVDWHVYDDQIVDKGKKVLTKQRIARGNFFHEGKEYAVIILLNAKTKLNEELKKTKKIIRKNCQCLT